MSYKDLKYDALYNKKFGFKIMAYPYGVYDKKNIIQARIFSCV